MKIMRILVTGSSGLIGQWLCGTLLKQGHEVIGLDILPQKNKADITFQECNILDDQTLKKIFTDIQPEHVVHLAARVDLEEKSDINGYTANIDGVRNILNCVKEAASIKRVIVTSSQLVCKVGYVPKDFFDYCPNTLYGESKVLTEKITREMDGGGKEWCLVRPTTVWGPGMSPHYQSMLRLIQKGRFFHCGSGKLYKSYAYAANIAHQYAKLMQAETNKINRKTFYLADYEPLSLRDYINGLAEAMQAPRVPTVPNFLAKAMAITGDILNTVGLSRFPFNSFRLRNILTEYQFDLSETKAVCGELPYTFSDGVKETASWWLQQTG